MNKDQFVITTGLLNNNKFMCNIDDSSIIQIEKDNYEFTPYFKTTVVAHDLSYSRQFLVDKIIYNKGIKEISILNTRSDDPIVARASLFDDNIVSLYSFSEESDEILIVFNKIE